MNFLCTIESVILVLAKYFINFYRLKLQTYSVKERKFLVGKYIVKINKIDASRDK